MNKVTTLFLLTVLVSLAACSHKPDPARLLEAVRNNDVKTVEKCLKWGTDPDSTIEDGKTTALHLALYKGDFEMVKLLVSAGADLTAYDSERNVPLGLAAKNNDADIVAFLIGSGADVNFVSRNRYNTTALMDAANENALDALKVLIDNGADLDICDNMGYPAIAFAADKQHYESVVMLAEAGADIHIIGNYQDMNVVDWSIFRGDKKTEEYLLSKGAVPNSKRL
jgi:ankyrin repeat protein